MLGCVRAHLARSGGGFKGWLRALIDPQNGRALSLIHEKHEDDWTVESLASKVGMSRSAFAARFAQLVEEPPLTYLTRWRMQKASRLLETSQAGVAEVAKRVGYDAEAAFSKAFKRWIGVAPGLRSSGDGPQDFRGSRNGQTDVSRLVPSLNCEDGLQTALDQGGATQPEVFRKSIRA
jgi:AraC-like DNA-binding protein